MGRFTALRVRNFRLFFLGQFVSVIGNWMQTVALAALVLDHLDRGGTVLGLVTAMLYTPVIVLGPLGGLATDRFSKWRIVLTTQISFAVVVGLLGVLVITDRVTLVSVMILAAAQGAINAFDNPARQTLVHEMVGGELLTNAVGLNMLAMNTARVIGPAVAGLLLFVTSIGTLFVLNGLSFLGAVIALAAMRRNELQPSRKLPREPGMIRAGVRYAKGEPTIRTALLMLVVVGGLSYNFPVVLPATRSLTIGTAALGASLTMLSLSPTRLVVYLLLPFLGAASLNFLVLMNSTLQLRSVAEMRGRVMSLYTMALLGTTPVGALLVGWIAERFSARAAMAVGGIASILAAGWARNRFDPESIHTAPAVTI